MADNDKFWLVRSNGRILGPYNAAEIEDQILTREIIQVDEVCKPMGRWRYVKDVNEFQNAIVKLKARRPGRPEGTATPNAHMSEDTITSATTTGSFTEELTPVGRVEPSPSRTVIPRARSGQAEIVLRDVSEEVVTKKSSSGMSNPNVKAYGTTETLGSKADADKTSRRLWSVVGVLSLLIVAAVGFQYFVRLPGLRSEQARHTYESAVNLLKQGDYRSALTAYKHSFELNPANKESHLYLGLLMIQLEEDIGFGRELLQTVLKDNSEYSHLALNGIGLSYLREGEIDRAILNFNKALDAQGDFAEAYINLGVGAFRLGDFKKARTYFNNGLEKKDIDESISLMLAGTLLNLGKRDNEDGATAKALSIIDSVLDNGYDFSQEAMLQKAYAKTLMKMDTEVQQHVLSLLDMHPGLTGKFTHNISVDRELVEWKYYGNWCKEVIKQLGDNSTSKTLEAVCASKSGNIEKARSAIETAVQMDPLNPLVQANYAYILRAQGLVSQATVARGKAVTSNRNGSYMLPFILQAEHCDDIQDAKCSLENWMEVTTKLQNYPLAIAGITKAYLHQGDQQKAKEQFDLGVKTYEMSFLPINKLYEDFARYYSKQK